MAKKPPVIDDKAFDNAFGRLAEMLDPFCEGSKHGVMATLISAFSGYIGHEVKVATSQGDQSLAAWFVLVGVSGKGRKGWTARVSMPVIEKAFKKWAETDIINGGVPATGLGFVDTLVEHQGRSMFILEQEMDSFIDNGGKDRRLGVALRKAWDGSELVHKTSKVDLRVPNPHLGFLGHVQPINWGVISGSKDATGGTYNRFLPLFVHMSKRLPRFKGPNPTEVQEECAQILKKMGNFAIDIERVTAPDDVAEFYEEIHRPICEGLTDGSDELSQMGERAEGYLLRLAALFALGDMRTEMSDRDLDSALALVTFAIDTIRYVLPNSGGESLAQKILRALQESWDPVTGEYIDLSMTELWVEIGRNYKKDEIREALKELPQVTSYTGRSSGGRPPVMLHLADGDEGGSPAHVAVAA